MNVADGSMYYQHMSAGPAPSPQTVTAGSIPHYSQQPPMLPSSAYGPYSQQPYYSHAQGIASPHAPQMGGSMVSNVLPLPGIPAPNGTGMHGRCSGFDTSGQVAPPGVKPRVTATLWEDEGSLCFQVEARGICVARREDNHMINGTKLLNVAGMTRGRRDGILKSEKTRHVVKIGPMHLKGVWIPFERALDFANKEKITELLYPLFVHNIGSLLYHPSNGRQSVNSMASAVHTKRTSPHQGLPPPLGLHNTVPSHGARPPMDRAHSFPTPPASASSVTDGIWTPSQAMSGGQATSNISIDTTTLVGARSMPSTPTQTPPHSSVQSMPAFPTYGAPSAPQPTYQQTPAATQDRTPLYTHQGPYAKTEMPPPSNRPAGTSGADMHDAKSNGVLSSDQSGQSSVHDVDDEPAHENDAEYTHNSGPYDSGRASYNYHASNVEHHNISADMTGSPSHHHHHPSGSGRATPRTTATATPYYPPNDYHTPARTGQQSSSLYSVMTNDQPATNGSANVDVYAPPAADIMLSIPNNKYSQTSMMNGSSGGPKRRRDDDDDDAGRPASDGLDNKRRKTFDTVTALPAYDELANVKPVAATRRR